MKMKKDYKDITKIYERISKAPEDPEFLKDYEERKVFKMTPTEYYLKDKYEKEHIKCKRNPDGSNKFGTIGGGHIVRFYFNEDWSYEVISECHGCGKSINLTEEAKKLKEEVPEKYIKMSQIYGGGNLGKVEYYRLWHFLEDHKGHKISIGFMGTGLGYLINVQDEDTKERADITDTSDW
jgi:hypothetical protein